ncbi:MAG: COX15/CtaA family protein [Acidimicrobiia bacterium]
MTRYTKIAVAAAISTFALIAAGGLVRATDSGLGCPDWPLCFGKWMPPADLHAWIEHAHRLIAGVLVVPLVGVVAVMTVFTDRRKDRPLLVASLVAAAFVLLQALLGAAVVLLRLAPELVTAHLAMALTVFAALIFIAERSGSGAMPPDRVQPAATHLCEVTLVLIFAQMLVGSWVTGHHAGLVYPDFPLMDGSVVPVVSTGAQLVQFSHRALSVLVAAAVLVTARSVWRTAATRLTRRLVLTLVVLTLVQLTLGALNVWWRLSALTVVPHLGVGAAMFGASVWMLLAVRRQAPSAAPPAPADAETPDRVEAQSSH